MLALAATLVVFGTTTQTWLHVSLAAGEVAQNDLNIPGNKAAVAVSALALVALAGTLALTIAGRIARVVIGIIVLLSAIGTIAVVLTVLGDPAAAAMTEFGAATGIDARPDNVRTTLFPVVALVGAAVQAVAAVLVLWLGRGWSVRSKYDTAKSATPRGEDEDLDDIDSWDSLSRGEDPTA